MKNIKLVLGAMMKNIKLVLGATWKKILCNKKLNRRNKQLRNPPYLIVLRAGHSCKLRSVWEWWWCAWRRRADRVSVTPLVHGGIACSRFIFISRSHDSCIQHTLFALYLIYWFVVKKKALLVCWTITAHKTYGMMGRLESSTILCMPTHAHYQIECFLGEEDEFVRGCMKPNDCSNSPTL
jgi:hypothetical protein